MRRKRHRWKKGPHPSTPKVGPRACTGNGLSTGSSVPATAPGSCLRSRVGQRRCALLGHSQQVRQLGQTNELRIGGLFQLRLEPLPFDCLDLDDRPRRRKASIQQCLLGERARRGDGLLDAELLDRDLEGDRTRADRRGRRVVVELLLGALGPLYGRVVVRVEDRPVTGPGDRDAPFHSYLPCHSNPARRIRAMVFISARWSEGVRWTVTGSWAVPFPLSCQRLQPYPEPCQQFLNGGVKSPSGPQTGDVRVRHPAVPRPHLAR